MLRFSFVIFCALVLARKSVADSLTVTPLGPASSIVLQQQALAINEQGVIAGVLRIAGSPQPFVWQDGAMTYLPNLPGATLAGVTGINASGQIVGFSDAADGRVHAVIWENGSIAPLPTAPNTDSIAHGINDAGEIVGAVGANASLFRAARWEDGAASELGPPTQSVAYGINNAGLIAGGGWPLGHSSQPIGFLWQDGTLEELGSQQIVTGSAVNSQGVMAGYTTVNGLPRAIIYQNGTPTPLELAPMMQSSIATDINDLGQIIGASDLNGAFPFLWQNGEMTLLQNLLPDGSPWLLRSIWDINNRGQIVGAAFNWDTRTVEAVLLTVPEPSTLLLMMVGAGIFLRISKRKPR